jgi:hypothetical protein
MTTRSRPIAEPFVVARPSGARVRTRLAVGPDDEAVLLALGANLGSLMGRDLAQRCREGVLDARDRAASRGRRKRTATEDSSSRWAGTITRTSEDAWALGWRNLGAQAASLRARVSAIRRRLSVPVGERRGRARGYASAIERFQKQRRLQILQARLSKHASARLKPTWPRAGCRCAGEDAALPGAATISRRQGSPRRSGGSGGKLAACSSAQTVRPTRRGATRRYAGIPRSGGWS